MSWGTTSGFAGGCGQELGAPASFSRNASADTWPAGSPLITLADTSLDGYEAGPRGVFCFDQTEPMGFETRMQDPSTWKGPLLDFRSMDSDGSAMLSALPLFIPPGCANPYQGPLSMSTDQYSLAPSTPMAKKEPELAVQVVATPKALTPAPPAVMEVEQPRPAIDFSFSLPANKAHTIPAVLPMPALPLEAPIEAPGKAPAKKGKGQKRPRVRGNPELEAELARLLKEQSDKMDLTKPLLEFAGLPVTLTQKGGETYLGKYTLSQRKARIERFNKKFAHIRPPVNGRKKKQRPKCLSRSRFARSRKRIGGRFVSKDTEVPSDIDD